MMKENASQTWHSGDWKNTPGDKPPYNGLEISATPKYSSSISSPPETGKLESVEVIVTDYTYDKTGCSSIIDALTIKELWADIPIPSGTSSPPGPDPDFTVCNIEGTGPGKVKLERTTNGIFLRIQLKYGLKDMQREELGFILMFEPTD